MNQATREYQRQRQMGIGDLLLDVVIVPRGMLRPGDDVPAKKEVAKLIDRLGFVPIDLGDFETGSRLQQFPSGPLAGINVVQFP